MKKRNLHDLAIWAAIIGWFVAVTILALYFG